MSRVSRQFLNDGTIGKAVMTGVMIVITMIILFMNDKKKIFR